MARTAQQLARIHPALRLAGAPAADTLPAWGLAALAGRLGELSGQGPSALLSLACGLVREAQAQGEPAAWVTPREGTLFPPDADAAGVDLAALVVVLLPAAGPAPALAAARSADRLVRSGAFGLVVLDLVDTSARLPLAALSRLVQLARQYHTAVLCLTSTPAGAPSLGPVVAWRAEGRRRRLGPGRFACTVRVEKEKLRGPGAEHTEVYRGPPGLR